MTDTDAFVARDSKWRLALLTLAAAVFVFVSAWMAGFFGEPPESRRLSPEMTTLVGWVGLVFFGFGLFVLVRRFQLSGEAFRIDASGITHAQMVKERYTWDEITMLRPVRIGRQEMIAYEVVQERLDQMGGLKAKLAAANRSMTGCSFALSIAGTDAKMADVVAAIEHFAPERLLVID